MQAGNVEFEWSEAQDAVLLDKFPADLPPLSWDAHMSTTLVSPLRRVETCPQLTAHTASRLFGIASNHASANQVHPTTSTLRPSCSPSEPEAVQPLPCSSAKQVCLVFLLSNGHVYKCTLYFACMAAWIKCLPERASHHLLIPQQKHSE